MLVSHWPIYLGCIVISHWSSFWFVSLKNRTCIDNVLTIHMFVPHLLTLCIVSTLFWVNIKLLCVNNVYICLHVLQRNDSLHCAWPKPVVVLKLIKVFTAHVSLHRGDKVRLLKPCELIVWIVLVTLFCWISGRVSQQVVVVVGQQKQFM